MKIRIPVLTKDPSVAAWKGVPLYEMYSLETEDVLLDGPVSRRVAILDFDPATGSLAKGATFLPPKDAKSAGLYQFNNDGTLKDNALHQVLVFGGVHKTIEMFEESDALGRRIDWAFDGPQLLVVPRAGEWANAFYERDSRSLQFFYLTPANGGAPIFTSHSQDIIAHETAHAIIDGVVPDVYDAAHPESLALHESIADIATILMAFRSRSLVKAVLEMTNGSIRQSSAFTGIAEQFAEALDQGHDRLRELNNTKTMKTKGLDLTEPHALSEVLSGALYGTLVAIYEEIRAESDSGQKRGLTVESEVRDYEASDAVQGFSSGKALWIAGQRFKRTVIRGLDYLPPGEVTFADYGRAVIASDEASHPDSPGQRQRLVAEFVKRSIVSKASDLKVKTNYHQGAVLAADLETLARSDWAAYQFAEKNRAFLGIPDGPFEVRPRLDVTKTYFHKDESKDKKGETKRELIFKVAWTEMESSAVGGGLPKKRRVVRGTTLAIDWEKKLVRALLTTSKGKAVTQSRDAFIARMLRDDAIAIGADTIGPDGKPRRNAVLGDITDGALRLRATARALHMLSEVRS
jgi:hypothetical protein